MPISTFLSGRAPTTLRGLMFLAFSDVAVIQAPAATSDTGGGASRVYQNAGTVPCRIYPVTTRARGGLVGGQVNEHSTHFCAMPPATQISTLDRILIAGRGTFEVTIELETTDSLSTRVEVMQIS